MITSRSVDCHAPACASTQLQLSSERVSTGSRRRLVPASHRTRGSFGSSLSEPRPACAMCRSSSFARLRTHPACAFGPNIRPGLLDRPAACAACRSFGSRPGGELRLAPLFPPPRRPAGNLRAFARGPSSGWACDELLNFTRTFTKSLRPWRVSALLPAAHLRNCTSGSTFRLSPASHSSGRASVAEPGFRRALYPLA